MTVDEGIRIRPIGLARGVSPLNFWFFMYASFICIGMWRVGILGWLLDRVNRVTGLAIAMALGGAGYSSMWLVSSPLDFSMLPWFILLSIGQVSAICASVTLVGQEARPAKRGAVIAMNGFFGAIGIFLAFALGGRLFDAFGPSAPSRRASAGKCKH